MKYQIEFKPRLLKGLKALPSEQQSRILAKIEMLQDNLVGDVERMTNYTSEYRLRVEDIGYCLGLRTIKL